MGDILSLKCGKILFRVFFFGQRVVCSMCSVFCLEISLSTWSSRDENDKIFHSISKEKE